ncbi:hypothetical protein OG21DRAFT_550318 [Imleria badia]|nr:hypothetical protein OG21DRAFT_550318 [Imleria badia]
MPIRFPTALKAWCARATRSRITTAFFLFVLANYAAQATLHTMILSGYARSRVLVTSAINAAGVQRSFTVVQNDVLEICSGIPTVYGTTCHTVYNGSAISTPTSTGMQCAEGLTWLENYLRDSRSEEVVYLALESWLVVISLIALVDESIPHLIVVLAAQLVNAGWISYRVARDISAKHTYDEIIVNGTCGAFDILGGSWQYNMFCVTLGCSIAALFAMILFAFKLVKLYSKATLSSVGSPPIINRMLKWRLWMRVFIQFTTFFTIAAAAVWYDKRKSDTMASYYTRNILYDAGFYIVIIIISPWLALGTYSISKEKRFLFLVYALLSICLLVISGLWFGSALFRYEYMSWRTFSCVTTMADILLVITCILSVICRLNFGKGLAHFLVVEQKLQASGFAYDTFLNGPSSSVGIKQVFTHDRPEPLSHPALNQSQPSFKTPKYPPSVCSVETALFATWLSSTGSGDQEKCEPQTAKEERPASTFIISTEDMRLCGVQCISDSETTSLDEVDEKQSIAS